MGEEKPKVNREAMLGAFRGSLSYDVYQEFLRLKGDDQLLLFYLSWWQKGLTKATVEGAAEEAGYARSRGAALAQHPAVKFLYQALGRDDVAAQAEITTLFFAGIKRDMKSPNAATRTKCYATWNSWLKENAARYDEQLLRAERLKRAAVEPPQQKDEPPTIEMLCHYLVVAWKEISSQGIDPRSVLEKEKNLKFPVSVPTETPLPSPTVAIKVVQVPSDVKN